MLPENARLENMLSSAMNRKLSRYADAGVLAQDLQDA